MKVLKRFDVVKCSVHVHGQSKTEVGLVIPIRKLVLQYQQGKEVPKLANNLPFSVPVINRIDYDLIDYVKINTNFSKFIEQMKEQIPS